MTLSKALQEAKRDVAASLRALQPILITQSPSGVLTDLLPGLPVSLAQLLTRLHHETTALALAFKPPVTVSAAVSQLQKVQDAFGRIAACVLAASGAAAGASGSVLLEEWKDGVESIGAELRRLLQVLEDAGNTPLSAQASSSKSGDNPYLTHTGLVWDAIDKLSKTLSKSEVEAVTKKWKGQGEVMKDAWGEFKEFLQEQEEAQDQDDEEGEEGSDLGENGFEEDLEDIFTEGTKMSSEERARAEALKPLLGLHQILQSTIPRYLPLLVLSPEETYQPVLQSNTALTAAFDVTVSAMYPEQDEDEIEESISVLNTRSLDLVKTIRARLDRAEGEETAREACRSFLTKWEARLEKEKQAWKDRRLSLASLGHALQA